MGMIQIREQNVTGIESSNKESEDLTATEDQVDRPDPEVLEKPQRRTFTAAYKLKILEAVDNCSKSEERGAILRREGLYHSHLLTWRKQRESGQISGLTPRKRGRKAKPVDPLSAKVEKLERENERLRRELNKAGAIIDAQKKISSLMGILQEETGIERRKS
jgi:transposase